MTTSYNLRNPAVKRLLQEARELECDPPSDYSAHPLEDNLFEWHFVMRGPDDTEFEGGRYHGRILLPSEYPFKPPNIMLMTPNGRFELNKKICLSITGYHPEYWLPAWGIRTVLLGLLGFMTTKANGAIGGIDYTEAERKVLAARSRSWKCPKCGTSNIELLPDEQRKSDSTSKPETTNDTPKFLFVYEEDRLKKSQKACANPADKKAESQEARATELITDVPTLVKSEACGSSTSTNAASRAVDQQAAAPAMQPRNVPITLYLIDTAIVTLLIAVAALLARKFA